jgi:hypothetical protein
MPRCHAITRRTLLLSAAAMATSPPPGAAEDGKPLVKPIPSSGEALPVVGLGTWITFNVGNDAVARDACAHVIQAFLAAGGRLIDSSPMYGSSRMPDEPMRARMAAHVAGL